MRITRYETGKGAVAVLINETGSAACADLSWGHAIAAVHAGKTDAFNQPLPEGAKLEPPVGSDAKILCVGVNYKDHGAEARMEMPAYPNIFTRYKSSLVPDGGDLILPLVSDKFDYEAELVAVIGQGGRHIAEAQALDHVLGYTIGMDGSIRDYQKRVSQFAMGKNFDRSGALGPTIVTAGSLPKGAAGLGVRTRLNGAIMQDGNTRDLVFGVAALIAALSEAMTLNAGDVIFTGTPSGVGFARKPPLFLKDGDSLETEIEGIGTLRNRVRAEA